MRSPLLAIALTGLVLAPADPPETEDGAPSARRGYALVQTNCASCHAVGPAEDSPLRRAPPFRSLGERYPVRYLEEALVEGIVTAHPDMPAFAFSAEEAADIVAYLERLPSAVERRQP